VFRILCSFCYRTQKAIENVTSNLSKAHVTHDTSRPATLAISVGLQQ